MERSSRERVRMGSACVLTLLSALCAGCDGGSNGPRDAAQDDGGEPDGDADSDQDGAWPDAEVDGDGPRLDADTPAEAGPMTFVMVVAEVSGERLCDFDGDGDLDNTFADLGSPTSDLAIMALNSTISASIEERRPRLVHLPWVADLTGLDDPDAVLIIADATDGDVPPDPEDDRVGGESFWIDPRDLDVCGEPLYAFLDASIAAGAVESGLYPTPLNLFEGIKGTDARVFGEVEADRSSADLFICAYATAHDLGAASGFLGSGDLTLLELFATGGAAVGVPMIPGFSMDVDVDHDGLESFLLDDDNHIRACVDGDMTVIDGRDCWQDERIADGFGLSVHIPSIDATCLGRPDGWEDFRPETCDDPPEESLLDPR